MATPVARSESVTGTSRPRSALSGISPSQSSPGCPLHARHVVEAEGFSAFAERPRRLRLFLDHYGWGGDLDAFLRTVRARVLASADGIERTASLGDLAYQQMLRAGVADSLRTAAAQLAQDTADLARPPR